MDCILDHLAKITPMTAAMIVASVANIIALIAMLFARRAINKISNYREK